MASPSFKPYFWMVVKIFGGLFLFVVGVVVGVQLAESHDNMVFDAFLNCEANLVGYEQGVYTCTDQAAQACILQKRYDTYLGLMTLLENETAASLGYDTEDIEIKVIE